MRRGNSQHFKRQRKYPWTLIEKCFGSRSEGLNKEPPADFKIVKLSDKKLKWENVGRKILEFSMRVIIIWWTVELKQNV